jgi:UDPglucose--hexose-1-phosphate uridylyltransferase
MSEFRQNPITKNWVLIAPSRGKRPEQFKSYSVMQDIAELDPACIFCPQNEDLRTELIRYDSLGNRISKTNGDWEIRIIPNKFAALENSPIHSHKEFYVSHSGNGVHEVVITKAHNQPVALQSILLVEQTLKIFIERINLIAENKDLAYIQIFHNHGRDAGASIIHPHYQLIATPIVPPHIHEEILGCYHYFQNHKECIYCDIIKEEVFVKHRVVHENEHFVVVCPYASRSPFETWIIPKRHSARFEDMSEEEVRHLSFVLKVTLGQLYIKLSDPPLNFYIHNMPIKKSGGHSFGNGGYGHSAHREESFHWHIVIFPRLTIWAGFEYATGIPVNPMPPEDAAKFLKG